MVSLLVKVLLVFILILGADVAIQEATGGIYVRGETYRLTDLIVLLFEGLATFLAINVHAVTHALDVEAVVKDMSFNMQGLMAFIMWSVGAVFDLTLHFIAIPFDLIASAVPALGVYIGIFDFGGLMIDFHTLTVSVKIGAIDNVDIFGVRLELENEITFSLLGIPEDNKIPVYLVDLNQLDELGGLAYYEFEERGDKLQGFLAFSIFMDDRVWTKPLGVYEQFPPFIEFPIVFTENLQAVFDLMLEEMNIPTPRRWIEAVWAHFGIDIYGTQETSMILRKKVRIDV